jgi:hypothetical protein
MNRQEALRKTEDLERQLAELKAIIEAPDISELVFKPEIGDEYVYVDNDGRLERAEWIDSALERMRLKLGNVFRIGEAKNSAKYYIMNSDYDYWLPWSGQPKPKVLPKGLEYWWAHWKKSSCSHVGAMDYFRVYRWKRSEQV